MSILAHFKRGMVFLQTSKGCAQASPFGGRIRLRLTGKRRNRPSRVFKGWRRGVGATSLSAGGLGEAEGLVQVNDLSVQKCRDENPHKVWHIIKRRFRRKRLDDKDHDHD